MKKSIILCVDDEVNILKSLERALHAPDLEIRSATTPAEAFQILKGQDVDLVITDQRMPKMEGAEFLKRIRQKYPQTQRILISGYSDFDNLVKAVNEGEITRFIAKPWHNDELRDIVRRTLAQKKGKVIMERLFMSFSQIAHLADNISVEPLPEDNSVMIRIQEGGRVFTKEALQDFLVFLFSSLGLSTSGRLKWFSEEAPQTLGQITMTIDLGKGITLKVALPQE